MTRLLAGSLLLLALLSGCAEDADEVGTGAEPSAQETSLQDCEALVPDSVLDTLGWSAGTPSLDLGRCVLTTSDGSNVSVVRRPTATAGAEALEERCDEVGAEDVGWVPEAGAQCGTTGPEQTSTGVLLVLTDDSTLLEARVDPRTPTDPDVVQAALVEVVQAAAAGL